MVDFERGIVYGLPPGPRVAGATAPRMARRPARRLCYAIASRLPYRAGNQGTGSKILIARTHGGLAGGRDSRQFKGENINRRTAHPISDWDLEIDRPMLESRFLLVHVVLYLISVKNGMCFGL